MKKKYEQQKKERKKREEMTYIVSSKRPGQRSLVSLVQPLRQLP